MSLLLASCSWHADAAMVCPGKKSVLLVLLSSWVGWLGIMAWFAGIHKLPHSAALVWEPAPIGLGGWLCLQAFWYDQLWVSAL